MVCRPPPLERVDMAKLTNILDANLLHLTVEAVREYILFYQRNDRADEVIQAFILLCAIKREYSDVAAGILGDQKIEPASRSSTALPISIESTELALRFVNGKSPTENRRPRMAESEYTEMALFLWAIRKHYRKIVVVLLGHKGMEVNETELEYWSPLGVVARHGSAEVINILLSEGIDKETRCNGWAILQLASGAGHQAVVERLLDAGADVNADPAYHSGRTALQAAAGEGHQAVVARLLKAHANVNAKPAYKFGRTALQAAAGGGHQAVVERLLDVGAVVNAPESDSGRTALQAAAEGGHRAVVERLL